MTTTSKSILTGIVAVAALAIAGCGEKPAPKLHCLRGKGVRYSEYN